MAEAELELVLKPPDDPGGGPDGPSTDPARYLARAKGPPAHAQAAIIRWLLRHGAESGPVDTPGTGRLARDLNLSRQTAHQAFHALVRRGYIESTPIADDRGWSRVTLTLPKAVQASLFYDPGQDA